MQETKSGNSPPSEISTGIQSVVETSTLVGDHSNPSPTQNQSLARGKFLDTWYATLFVALGTVLCVATLRWAMGRYLEHGIPYVLFLSAVAVTAYVCGVWGGIVAAGLSVLVGSYAFASPKGSLLMDNMSDLISVVVFCFAAAVILLALHLAERAKQQIIDQDALLLEQMSARADLERELAESRKLEGLGRLAGGVAHDFNNLLSVILGSSELLREKSHVDPELVDAIEIASKRGAEITRQLLSLARRQMMTVRPITLNEVVEEAQKFLSRLIPEDIRFDWRLENSPWAFDGDPTQLQQVLINLMTNARDAMPEGGTIRVETANCTLDERFTKRHPEVTPGEYAALFVLDDGKGMTDEVRRSMFDPFFSTKEAHRGTGLGLALVHGIVKQLKGHILVGSQSGVGTSIQIYFPRAISSPLPRLENQESLVPAARALSVLLVEDNELVREVSRRMLVALGHQVLVAENGAVALDLSRNFEGSIDVLVTDVVMPWMNGREVAERLRRSRPELRIVFVSGYTENVILRKGIVDSGVQLLKKPFTREELGRALEHATDSCRAVAT